LYRGIFAFRFRRYVVASAVASENLLGVRERGIDVVVMLHPVLANGVKTFAVRMNGDAFVAAM
jgi:hypothetical protein